MPWREASPMEQRMQFVLDYQSGLFTMTELAAQYGIVPKTGYKWIGRYEVDGLPGLAERSRRPHGCPHATDPRLIEALVTERRRHPRWGARKLLGVLARQHPGVPWPKRSTVCDVLKREGLILARRRRHRRPPAAPRAAITAPNETWTTDFKGEFRTGDGRYCYPLTLRDGFSRYVLRCDALAGPTYAATRPRFERAFAEYGLPARIRSDNGPPFASTGVGRLSRLAVWWIRLGIVPERIAVGHPEQNGSHEQFHRELKAGTTRPPARTLRGQQRRFDVFCAEYNDERPHEALADQTPATAYVASARPWPRRLPPIDYPGHFEVRRIFGNGCFCWRNHVIFLSNALMGEDVAFEAIDDGLWTVYFASVALARFDERRSQLQPLASFTEGRSASCAGSAPDRRIRNADDEYP
jgi:putative transposase